MAIHAVWKCEDCERTLRSEEVWKQHGRKTWCRDCIEPREKPLPTNLILSTLLLVLLWALLTIAEMGRETAPVLGPGEGVVGPKSVPTSNSAPRAPEGGR